MNEGKIPVRYAKALFETALSRKAVDKVFEDMNYVGEACRIPQIAELLVNPVITPSRKTSILKEIFGKEISDLTMSLIGLMVKNGREAFLPSVARNFRDLTLKYKGITETSLVTAVPVSNKTKKTIEDFISGKFNTKVILKENIDPELLGGFVLKVNDYFIDASLRSRLRKIRKELSGSANL